jgi:hypothetical protein
LYQGYSPAPLSTEGAHGSPRDGDNASRSEVCNGSKLTVPRRAIDGELAPTKDILFELVGGVDTPRAWPLSLAIADFALPLVANRPNTSQKD